MEWLRRRNADLKIMLDILSRITYNNETKQATACACKALRHNSVPECLVMRSFREGLCSETSNRSRSYDRKKMLRRPCLRRAAFLHRIGFTYE